jgi:hypothetical protein
MEITETEKSGLNMETEFFERLNIDLPVPFQVLAFRLEKVKILQKFCVFGIAL